MDATHASANTDGDTGFDGQNHMDSANANLFGAMDLPAEIWLHILASVDPRWRFCARSVCRQWRALVEHLPVPCGLDVPARERRLARGYCVCVSAAALAYCHGTLDRITTDTAPYGKHTESADGTGDKDDNGSYPMLAVDRILLVAGWTHDGSTKRRVSGLDIVVGLLHTGDEAAVDAAFSWLETRPQQAAACLTPSDPCDAYATVGRVLARHARIDWVRRAERAFTGFVARDHCAPVDALLSGDSAFAAEVNGTQASRWYACAQVWEAAGRMGAANVVRDLVAAAETDASTGTYQGLPPCLKVVHWHAWPFGARIHPRQQVASAFESCAQIAARAAIACGHIGVIDALFERAGDAGGLAVHANRERELTRLFDDASLAASRQGVAWCLSEAARTSTFLDVVKSAAMAVTPIFLRADTHIAHRGYAPYGNGQAGDKAQGKWYRGARVVAWLRESREGGLGAILDAPKVVAAIVDHARMAKTQLALMLVYAPALASMYADDLRSNDDDDDDDDNSNPDDGHGGRASDDGDGSDENAIGIVKGVVRGACKEAFLNGKIEILERMIAALDALAHQPPLDHLVARIDLSTCVVVENVGAYASGVLVYARHRAAGLGMTEAAEQATVASGKTLQVITPWTYEASKGVWRRWWPLCSSHGGACV
ncbi:F-box domain containing protein [Pandoravirus macleodensis]|uniref:F-box domain containing protein n=1 Tax=Pandoravirus macleodensis TaxID=2107707 RepID=A0A2U7UFI7_9VIRU|nr:F-box domain containing protein [Pandoravirus macleodensis]AVK77233.1 F-box domain containing protein [Pandoravirus macleodensis]